MAGILNNKTRIMDTIITVEGKRQLGRGNFRPEFASFTDGQSFYESESDPVSGSTDATDRILFESVSLPCDKIFLEYDDSGRLLGSSDIKVNPLGGNAGGIFLRTGSDGSYSLGNNNNFGSIAETMVSGSIDNLNRHQILSSHIPNKYNDFTFNLSSNKIDFVIDNLKPYGKLPNDMEFEVSAMKPFLYDKKLAHLPHFKFLPPVRDDGLKLGRYKDLNDKELLTFDELIQTIGELPDDSSITKDENQINLEIFGDVDEAFVNAAKLNYVPNLGKPKEAIKFLDTTGMNNLFAQCFEIKEGQNNNFLEKLSVIDFGSFKDNNDKKRKEKRVFFVGKIKEGVGGLPTFINIFTLIFD
jgi:hypothetical protein